MNVGSLSFRKEIFTSARLKLTAWYLLIIMLVSISFSVAIYEVLTTELDRVERVQRLRQGPKLTLPINDNVSFEIRQRIPRQFIIDPELIKETKERLKIFLAAINVAILGGSSLAGLNMF